MNWVEKWSKVNDKKIWKLNDEERWIASRMNNVINEALEMRKKFLNEWMNDRI